MCCCAKGPLLSLGRTTITKICICSPNKTDNTLEKKREQNQKLKMEWNEKRFTLYFLLFFIFVPFLCLHSECTCFERITQMVTVSLPLLLLLLLLFPTRFLEHFLVSSDVFVRTIRAHHIWYGIVWRCIRRCLSR